MYLTLNVCESLSKGVHNNLHFRYNPNVGGGSVWAPHLIVNNNGSTIIGKSINDTDPTIALLGVMML